MDYQTAMHTMREKQPELQKAVAEAVKTVLGGEIAPYTKFVCILSLPRLFTIMVDNHYNRGKVRREMAHALEAYDRIDERRNAAIEPKEPF